MLLQSWNFQNYRQQWPLTGRTFRKGNPASERVALRRLDSRLQDEFETKWGIKIHLHKSSFYSSLVLKRKRKKSLLIHKTLIRECGARLGVWEEIVNKQLLKMVELTKSQNTGLADLIMTWRPYLALWGANKNNPFAMTVFPFCWINSSMA